MSAKRDPKPGQVCYGTTSFGKADANVWLRDLFGLNCGWSGQDKGPNRARGLLHLDTDRGTFEADGLTLCDSSFKEDQVCLAWCTPDKTIRIDSHWQLCNQTGIWSRKDILANRGLQAITVFRCLARFVFSPGKYELYSQASRWANENQGSWRSLDHGSVVLGCEGARTTQGGTPYMCLREVSAETGIAFHILPRGNWTIRASVRPTEAYGTGDSLPFTVIELGLADENLKLCLGAGESIELPEIIFQPLPKGSPHLGAPNLHRYVLRDRFASAKMSTPVVYNPWFDKFDVLHVSRLRQQLTAAREIGCEVFTVDAGWYGAGPGGWWEQTGDWREKPDSAFKGRMSEFAEEVRAAGLGFGLWVEPARLHEATPIRQKHPDWFLSGVRGFYYPELNNKHVYAYLLSEMSRLVESYGLVWFKIDYNCEFGVDHSGAEFSSYYERWYRLLDELRSKYPHVFFEGCASGAMQLDLESLSHYDGHFLSDNCNPFDALRIFQGTLLRLPPGRLTKWFVFKPMHETSSESATTPIDPASAQMITPSGCGANWDSSEVINLDFAARVALPGMFGLSGDIAGLPKDTRQRIGHHVEFFKKWREFIAGSVAHLLTLPHLKGDRTGWAAVQLQCPDDSVSLLFIYRLDDPADRKRFFLQDLDKSRTYTVLNDDAPSLPPESFKGAELINDGLTVELAQPNTAAVLIISPA